ncbi:hypothetical protein SaccyDRAFT_0211 [Saccharomonospora cyanea NA-134]|uniref:Uncharacterized protein n=1 Tax=Saccharomonospora cyanea NA-134 TaxID=882082 RepID=H5XD70_9PSEU|nr:hypothetical protein SaccyDRAFT_0211 [Saccharomonospora cyanea NA-134]
MSPAIMLDFRTISTLVQTLSRCRGAVRRRVHPAVGVSTLRDDRIAAVTAFLDADHSRLLGLPEVLA